jgi:hypothetical protein
MFDRKYSVKVYQPNQPDPVVTFVVVATQVVVDRNVVKIDGTIIRFPDHQYIAIEQVS